MNSIKIRSHYAFFCIFVCNLRKTQRMGSILKEWVLYPKNGFYNERMGSIPKEWVL